MGTKRRGQKKHGVSKRQTERWGTKKKKQIGRGQKHRKGVKKVQNWEGENTEIIGPKKTGRMGVQKQEGEEKDSSHLLVLINQIIRHAEKVYFGNWPNKELSYYTSYMQ